MKMGTNKIFRQLYYKTTGYSFTHIARMFLRLFTGLMLAQFGVRQLLDPCDDVFLGLPYIDFGLPVWLIIIVEIICPFCIMIGLFTRLMLIPPFILMIVSCASIGATYGGENILIIQMYTIPFLFMGLFSFLLLSGAGKISVDYFYSLYLINTGNEEETELEEV